MIEIRPLEFSWIFEWQPLRERHQAELRQAIANDGPIAACAVAGRQERELNKWIHGLSDNKKRDVIDLLNAEHDLLYELIDPSGQPLPPIGSYQFSEFRQRYYDAVTLLRAVTRVGLQG